MWEDVDGLQHPFRYKQHSQYTDNSHLGRSLQALQFTLVVSQHWLKLSVKADMPIYCQILDG